MMMQPCQNKLKNKQPSQSSKGDQKKLRGPKSHRETTPKSANTPMGATKESTWDSGPVKAVKITT
jgi:hypothetical protein